VLLAFFLVASSGVQITTGITWDSEKQDIEADGSATDKQQFKPRTSVSSLAELERFLHDQLVKDEMSVIVSFFEEEMIQGRKDAYLTYLRAGGVPQNAMMAFALCTDLDLPRALHIPAPLPRTVAFSPVEGVPGRFEMRQAKFFDDGQVFLDGVLPVLATLVSDKENEPSIQFPTSVREAVLGAKLREDAAKAAAAKPAPELDAPSFLQSGEL